MTLYVSTSSVSYRWGHVDVVNVIIATHESTSDMYYIKLIPYQIFKCKY